MADGLDLTEMVKRAAQANAKFYKGWMDLSFEYLRAVSEILGGPLGPPAPVQETDAGTGALVLEGEAGSVVRGTFLVSNDLERSVSCKFVGSDFKDPRGVTVAARVVFDPPGCELGPGEQRVVEVAIQVDESLTPGVGYASEISIGGMDGFAVPVVLRRQHEVDDAGTAATPSEAEPTTGEPARAAPAARRRKSAAKKRGARKATR